MDYDLIIKNGQLYDGAGNGPLRQDIAVKDGVIARIAENIDGTADRVFDARGKIVTPGFVDVHTHYDGQATWDVHLKPSSNLGTTTVVMGNCGVGFAPCREQDHDVLIKLMEGDISVKSTLGKGSEFHVLLPIHQDAVSKKEEKGSEWCAFFRAEKDTSPPRWKRQSRDIIRSGFKRGKKEEVFLPLSPELFKFSLRERRNLPFKEWTRYRIAFLGPERGKNVTWVEMVP